MSSKQSPGSALPFAFKILLVDQDQEFLSETQQRLEKSSYEVELFQKLEDVVQNLDGASTTEVGVIIVEKEQYYGASQVVRQSLITRSSSYPLIMSSRECCQQSVYQAVQNGFVDVWQKPFEENQLKFIWQHIVRMEKIAGKKIDNSRIIQQAKVKEDDTQRISSNNSRNQFAKGGSQKKKIKANVQPQESEQLSKNTQQDKEANYNLVPSPKNCSSKGQAMSKVPSARSNSSNQSSDLVDQIQLSSYPSNTQAYMPPNYCFPGFQGQSPYGAQDPMFSAQNMFPCFGPHFQKDYPGMPVCPPFPPMIPELPFIPGGVGSQMPQVPFPMPMPNPSMGMQPPPMPFMQMLPENCTPEQFGSFQKAFMDELQRFNQMIMQNPGANPFGSYVPDFSNLPFPVDPNGFQAPPHNVNSSREDNNPHKRARSGEDTAEQKQEKGDKKQKKVPSAQPEKPKQTEETNQQANLKQEEQSQQQEEQLKQELRGFDFQHIEEDLAFQTFEDLFEDENKLNDMGSPRFRDGYPSQNGGMRKLESFNNLVEGAH